MCRNSLGDGRTVGRPAEQILHCLHNRDIEGVKELLHTKKVDVNDPLKFGDDKLWSALILACWKDNYQLAKFLLDNAGC